MKNDVKKNQDTVKPASDITSKYETCHACKWNLLVGIIIGACATALLAWFGILSF